MKNIDMLDAYFFVGLAALCVGVGAYDWRFAAITCGAVLVVSALIATLRRGGE